MCEAVYLTIISPIFLPVINIHCDYTDTEVLYRDEVAWVSSGREQSLNEISRLLHQLQNKLA
jgi:hypothetical protein